jgi:hypothetical protein
MAQAFFEDLNPLLVIGFGLNQPQPGQLLGGIFAGDLMQQGVGILHLAGLGKGDGALQQRVVGQFFHIIWVKTSCLDYISRGEYRMSAPKSVRHARICPHRKVIVIPAAITTFREARDGDDEPHKDSVGLPPG